MLSLDPYVVTKTRGTFWTPYRQKSLSDLAKW